jgi:hypothetical protein
MWNKTTISLRHYLSVYVLGLTLWLLHQNRHISLPAAGPNKRRREDRDYLSWDSRHCCSSRNFQPAAVMWAGTHWLELRCGTNHVFTKICYGHRSGRVERSLLSTGNTSCGLFFWQEIRSPSTRKQVLIPSRNVHHLDHWQSRVKVGISDILTPFYVSCLQICHLDKYTATNGMWMLSFHPTAWSPEHICALVSSQPEMLDSMDYWLIACGYP